VVRGFTAPLNKFGAAGFFPMQIKAELFLLGRGGGGGGGGGEELAVVFHFRPAVAARRSGSSGLLLLHRGGGAMAAGVGGPVLCPAMVVWLEVGCWLCSAAVGVVGDLQKLSSSTWSAAEPPRFYAGKAAFSQPPSWRPVISGAGARCFKAMK
jgi:hypothetical protein